MIALTNQTVSTVPSFAPYAGPWTHAQAAHLLRRATYGPLKSEIDRAVFFGLTGTLNRILDNTAPLPDPPVFYDTPTNPAGNVGDPWVNLPLDGTTSQTRTDDNNERLRSLNASVYLNADAGGVSIREKMLFFWHNHFGVSGVNDSRAYLEMYDKYRLVAAGNFRDLVKTMTIDPVMLNFLDGNQNSAANPNENFAREFLELFTIGKGPQVGPGDYTTYTEQDVTELARAFTGWRTRYYNSTVAGQKYESYFQVSRHDATPKTLSHRFGGATITANGDQEYSDVVDLVFQQDEVARHICRKLYRFFVYYDLTPDVELHIIEPMAQLVITNNYELRPALTALFRSQHFYEDQIVGDMIKSPIEFMLSMMRPAGTFQQPTVLRTYYAARYARARAIEQGMQFRNPPSVAGWTAYYQEPTFNRLWLNTSTLQERVEVQRKMTVRHFTYFGQRYDTDWLAYIATFPQPQFADPMIVEMASHFLPKPLHPSQQADLKTILLDGQPDFVWTTEYVDYLANPGDAMLRDAVESRLQDMMYALFQLAEFQLQ